MKNTHWRCASRFRPVSTRLTLGFMETIRSRALTHVSAMRWSNRNRSITIAGARAREPSAHAGRAHTSPLCHQPRCTHVILPTDGTSITMPFILPPRLPPRSPLSSYLPVAAGTSAMPSFSNSVYSMHDTWYAHVPSARCSSTSTFTPSAAPTLRLHEAKPNFCSGGGRTRNTQTRRQARGYT